MTGNFAGGMVFLALVMLVGAIVALLLRNARVLTDAEG